MTTCSHRFFVYSGLQAIYYLEKGSPFLWRLIHLLGKQSLQNMHLLWHQKYDNQIYRYCFGYVMNPLHSLKCRGHIFFISVVSAVLFQVWFSLNFFMFVSCSIALELSILLQLKQSAIRSIEIFVGSLMLVFSLVMLVWGQRLLVSSWQLKY